MLFKQNQIDYIYSKIDYSEQSIISTALNDVIRTLFKIFLFMQDAVTHSSPKEKKEITVTWTPPPGLTEQVIF